MNWLLLISILTLGIYLTYIYLKHGVQPSISDSYRVIKYKPIFTFVMWLTAFPIIIVGEHGLLFFAGAGIIFVGTAPQFWQSLTKTVHFAGAIGGILLGTLWTFLEGMWWLATPFVIFTLLCEVRIRGKILVKLKNHTWWVEIAAFVMILVALFLR